jgi:cytochrome P450
MGLVGKFGSKLQQEVQRGGINPAELLQQTMGALGGHGGAAGMANMMQQMAQNPQVRQAARQQATRDRLRTKLDAKKAQQPPPQ